MGKMSIELSAYDLSMLFGLLALGRRYGDNQLHDWTGDMRERLTETLDILSDDNTMRALNEAEAELTNELK